MQRPVARIPSEPSAPQNALPVGATDCHVHMFGGEPEFSRDPGRLEDPAPGDLAAWLSRLRRQMAIVGVSRTVLVQSVVYREDNAITVAALEQLGTLCFRGIALVGPDVTAAALQKLHSQGIRGIRLNFRHAGALDLDGLCAIAPRLADAGLHAQVLCASLSQLDEVADRLATLPVPVVLDHHAGLRSSGEGGFGPAFLKWFMAGRFFVKLSAAYRIAALPYAGTAPLVQTLAGLRPDRLVWGSDWPYVMFGGEPPDAGAMLDALAQACATPELVQLVLVRTPEVLYGFDPLAGRSGAAAT